MRIRMTMSVELDISTDEGMETGRAIGSVLDNLRKQLAEMSAPGILHGPMTTVERLDDPVKPKTLDKPQTARKERKGRKARKGELGNDVGAMEAPDSYMNRRP